MTLSYKGKSVELHPTITKDYEQELGKPYEINKDKGYIASKWDVDRGGVIKAFGMHFDLIPADKVEILAEFLKYRPTPEDPMLLTWEDGKKYYVIFGEGDAFSFEEVIKDISGAKYYQGNLILISVTIEREV